MGQTCQVLPGNPTSSLYVGVIGVRFAPVHRIREKQNDCFKGWLVLDCTWLKALKWINDHQPGPGIKKAQEMFKVNESDTDTLLLFKKKALELAILIIQECESGSSRDALIEELLVLIERANVIRKEM